MMAEGAQLVLHAVRDHLLDNHARRVHVAEPARVHRFLHIHAEHEMVEQKLDVSLRLHRSAHETEAHVRLFSALGPAALPRVGARRDWDKTGNQRVKGTFPGGNSEGQALDKREYDAG